MRVSANIKRSLVLWFVLLLCGLAGAAQAVGSADPWDGTVATAFAGGDGSKAFPYKIATGAQLAYLSALCNASDTDANAPGVYYNLINDIDLDGYDWTPIGDPVDDCFYANFNGQNHTIYNMTLNLSGNTGESLRGGLFGIVHGGVIQNLILEDVDILATGTPLYTAIGGLAAVAEGTDDLSVITSIRGCSTSGSIVVRTTESGFTRIGGLIGRSYGSSSYETVYISNCCSTVEIRREDGIGYAYGGLVGQLYGSYVQNSYATGDIYISGNPDYVYSGTLLGRAYYSVCDYAYWNSDAQVLREYEGNVYDESAPVGRDFTDGDCPAIAQTRAFMQSDDFLNTLNARYTQYGTWEFIPGTNNGFPVSTLYAAEITLAQPDDYTFPKQVVGYGAITAHTVQVVNTGTADTTTVYATLKGTNHDCFTLSAENLGTITPGEYKSFSVQPVAGLAAGTYSAYIMVASMDADGRWFDISFTVEEPDYSVAAEPETLDFGTAVEGYTPAPAAQTVTVTNTGNQTVTVTLPTHAAYSIATTDSLTLAPAGKVTVSIRPKTGLSNGGYDATLTFTTNHSTSDSVTASFTVAEPDYTVSAEPETLDFGTVPEGYSAAPATQTVTVANTGNQTVTVTLPTHTAYSITTTDSLTLAPAGTAEISIQPQNGLPGGRYNATLTFATDHSTSDSVTVGFMVRAAVNTITAAPDTIEFGTELIGYAPVAAQTVTVQNTGDNLLSLVQPKATHYVVGWLSRTALNPGDAATFTLRPATGLPAGTYPETIVVEGSSGTQATVTVDFTVGTTRYGIIAISGNGIHHLSDPAGLSFTSPGAFAKFTGVSVDGTMLMKQQYSARAGSTVVTLPGVFLNSLSAGVHALKILFMDGYAETEFSIVDIPQTGDTRPTMLYAALAGLALAGLCLLRRRRHRAGG